MLAIWHPRPGIHKHICCALLSKFQQVRSITVYRSSYFPTFLYLINLTSISSFFISQICRFETNFSYSPTIVLFSSFVLLFLLAILRYEMCHKRRICCQLRTRMLDTGESMETSFFNAIWYRRRNIPKCQHIQKSTSDHIVGLGWPEPACMPYARHP